MSGADVGGDGSVQWRVFVDQVRKTTVRSRRIGLRGLQQSGVDETDPGERFSVGVRIPTDSGDFVRSLRAAADDAAAHAGDPGYVVSFVLPIEPRNSDQIQIRWNSSRPGPPHASSAGTPPTSTRRAATTKRRSPKKRGPSKARPRPAKRAVPKKRAAAARRSR